ncbi:MAG: hypothetical protein IKH63_03060 [Prevotella sp.]|nr:hypothetical protein [Prevotella sp.]
MKKILLLVMGAMLAFPSFAQEGEDVTHLIANPGFDEDLTFQVDGSMKEIISTKYLSDRSWAHVAVDSSVYAKPSTTSTQSRPDGRKLEATNGFIGRIKGWTIETNQTFPKCEWVYFGSIPYDLKAQAIPIADDGTTYLEVPQRPEAVEGENVGFAYLRAGWGGKATYKQVVNLPCAKYILTYWAINLNKSATNGTNLSKVTCRKDVFKDETGFNDTEWTMHTIEFTPTTDFTMEFGFESAGGSGSNPFLCIDGIKLFKVGEADVEELMKSDIFDYTREVQDSAFTLTGEVATYFLDAALELEDMCDGASPEELQQLLVDAKNLKEKLLQAQKDMASLMGLIDEANKIIETTNYPGLYEFREAINKYTMLLEEGGPDEIAQALVDFQKDITNYYMSQEATIDNPANFTHLVQNPWFVNKEAEPTVSEDGSVFYPLAEEHSYVNGSNPSDANSTGWTIGNSGGDQRTNFVQQLSCWNAWQNSGIDLSISQEITDLPNGFYKVSAQMITQPGCVTDQHVFAKSSLQSAKSNTLAEGLWIDSDPYNGTWETLTTTDAVIVVDGKLTIGAAGSGDKELTPMDFGGSLTDLRRGWFCVTDFKLLYCGPANEEQIAAALAGRVAEANEMINGMHFAADKASAQEIMAKYSEDANIETLSEAIALAETSEGKYNEIMEAGKTIPTVTDSLATSPEAYGAARNIVEYALNFANTWIASSEANYTDVDGIINQIKNYINTYAPVYNKASELAATSGEDVKSYLNNLLVPQASTLTSAMQEGAVIDEYVEALNQAIMEAEKQNAYAQNPDATDYTGFIRNPKAEAEAGWKLERGTGDKNSTSGQYYNTNESGHRYFDSYNSTPGALNYYGEQVVVGIPNGTYTIGVDVRTAGHGAFIFGANGGAEKKDTTFLEIPLQTYSYIDDATGNDTTVYATDHYGTIWQEACDKFANMPDSDPTYFDTQAIVNANGGNGFGWEHIDLPGIVVDNHVIVIGMTTDSLRTGVPFTGTWFSATNWTLTLTQKGDNSGWDGPLSTGIKETVIEAQKSNDGIYTINGVKVNAINDKGMYIIIRNGNAKKVLMK